MHGNYDVFLSTCPRCEPTPTTEITGLPNTGQWCEMHGAPKVGTGYECGCDQGRPPERAEARIAREKLENAERSGLTAGVVLIVHSGKVLTVTNRRYGGVSLPGGKTEPPERTIDAAVRELREETNLTARTEDLVLVASGSTAGLEERDVLVFLARRTAGFAKSVESGTEVSWLRWDELLAKSPFEGFYRQHFAQGVGHFRDTEMASRCTCRIVGLGFPGMPGGGFYTGDCTYHKP